MGNNTTYIQALTHLKTAIRERHPLLEANIHRTSFHNPWLEKVNYWKSLDSLATHMLVPAELDRWCRMYQFPVSAEFQKTIGLIFAGNIPLVGFHDFLTIYLSGHHAEIKLSSKDPYVFPAVLQLMEEADPGLQDRILIVDHLKDFDAVIATGSNNTNRYFRKYFGAYPSIFRGNRTSVAILDGNETLEDLAKLSHDIFDYFGLGCRNVSKIFVPHGYQFDLLLDALDDFSMIMNNTKYKNNYDYNLSIELLNKNTTISRPHVMLKQDGISLSSPIGMIYYDTYSDLNHLIGMLARQKDEIQTVVGKYEVPGVSRTDFGQAQNPGLFDYPDGEDLGHFLFQLTCTPIS